jgi:pilus assembly protein CpaB
MKPKTLMLLCVAVGCGLVAMIGVQQALNKPKVAEVATVRILTALADINPGEPLNEENVGFKEIAQVGAPEDAVTKPEEFAQRSLKVAIVKGDYITKGKLNEKGVMGKSAQIPDGKRIFTINVDETQSASNMLTPGDKVDVAVTFDVRTPTGMQTKSMTLLERVDVFAVQDQTKGDRIRSGDSGKVTARQVSLVVSPEEVNWLLLAKRKGQLELLWRNPTDKTVNVTKAATDQLLADLRGLDSSRNAGRSEEVPTPATAEEPKPVQEPKVVEEPKPAVPDLTAFLEKTQAAIASLPKPAPPAAPAKPPVPTWEVKVYRGNEIKAYAFEDSTKDTKQNAENKDTAPAKSASSAASLLQSFGLSLPVGAPAPAASTPAL